MVALSLTEAAYFRSRRLAPICFIRVSNELDALRSSAQAPLKFGSSGSSDLGAAEVWRTLNTLRHTRAASQRSRRYLIRVESSFLIWCAWGSKCGIYPRLSSFF